MHIGPCSLGWQLVSSLGPFKQDERKWSQRACNHLKKKKKILWISEHLNILKWFLIPGHTSLCVYADLASILENGTNKKKSQKTGLQTLHIVFCQQCNNASNIFLIFKACELVNSFFCHPATYLAITLPWKKTALYHFGLVCLWH